MSERTLVVGDIHGLYEALLRALDHADYRSSDRLVFLGDYLNRGDRSREVLDHLIDLAGDRRHVFLRGNHEEMVLKLFGGRTDYWYPWLEYGGGRACLRSYGLDPETIRPDGADYLHRLGAQEITLASPGATTQFIADLFPEAHLNFLLRTAATHETERFFFSHAGIEKGVRLMAQRVYADCFLKWGDEDFLADETRYDKIIIFGHFHLEKPLIRRNKACIALRNAVAVLDLDNRVIVDSEGRVTPVGQALWT